VGVIEQQNVLYKHIYYVHRCTKCFRLNSNENFWKESWRLLHKCNCIHTFHLSSWHFWIDPSTTSRIVAITFPGSSAPITAVPETIILAPAWRKLINITRFWSQPNFIHSGYGIMYCSFTPKRFCNFMDITVTNCIRWTLIRK